MVFLVAAVSFLAKNLTIFLTVESFIKGCMLIASTNNIVTFLYLLLVLQVFLLGHMLGLMQTREYFTFTMSIIILIPR